MKPKNPKYITVNVQFKKDLKGGHPHIIIYFDGDMRISVGVTHSPAGKSDDYYKLAFDPLGERRAVYIHTKAEIGHKDEFYGKMKKGVMTSKDYAVAKRYADKKRPKR